jgi:hypothetical protein
MPPPESETVNNITRKQKKKTKYIYIRKLDNKKISFSRKCQVMITDHLRDHHEYGARLCRPWENAIMKYGLSYAGSGVTGAPPY